MYALRPYRLPTITNKREIQDHLEDHGHVIGEKLDDSGRENLLRWLEENPTFSSIKINGTRVEMTDELLNHCV